jgi:putative FmdB family regulatory protein
MPTYEYLGSNPDCGMCSSIFEVVQSIKDEPLKKCPQCQHPIEKQISLMAGYIIKNREANQFKDIRQAKYWRDKNGVRHKVTPADGTSKSATVSKQTKSPEEVAAAKKRDAVISKKARAEASYKRFAQQQQQAKRSRK